MDAYFAAFIDQFEELAKVAKAQSQDPNLLTSGRNKTDPKNSPELLNIKKVFNNPRFDDKGLDPFAKVTSLLNIFMLSCHLLMYIFIS